MTTVEIFKNKFRALSDDLLVQSVKAHRKNFLPEHKADWRTLPPCTTRMIFEVANERGLIQ